MWLYNNELYHYGVLGMRWGRRKNRSTINEPKKKNVKDMSDAELRQRINRLQMERQYSQLTSKHRSSGVKFVNGVLVNSAQQTIGKYVSKYMDKGIRFVGNAMIDQYKKRR